MIPNPFTFLRAMLRTLRAKLGGYEVLVRDTTLDRRMFVCHRCKDLQRETMQCGICTCWVEAKALLSTEECPRKLWLSEWVKKEKH